MAKFYVIFPYNPYIFVLIQHSCFANMDFALDPSNSVIKRLWCTITNFYCSYLDNNNLTIIPDGSLAGMTNLQRLNLNDNMLDKIQAGLFDDLTSLQYL